MILTIALSPLKKFTILAPPLAMRQDEANTYAIGLNDWSSGMGCLFGDRDRPLRRRGSEYVLNLS